MAKKVASKKSVKSTKATKVTVENNSFSVAGDGCRDLAKMADGKLSVDQCRILRALGSVKGRAIDRGDLKELVGIGRQGLYSSSWLNGLNELDSSKLIKIESHEPADGGRAKFVHSITAKGKELLAKLERGVVEATKADAKQDADKAKAKAAKADKKAKEEKSAA